MQLLYSGYILPLIDYCCVVWGNCSNEGLNRILKLQIRTAILILDQDTIRVRPFNLKGGGGGGGGDYGFFFRSEFFFRTTRELEYLFFLSCIQHYAMTKTLNQIFFFPPPKSEYFFQQHSESK